MKKMKTVFIIDRGNSSIAINEVMPGSEWVLKGEGIATVKMDGTSCLVRDGKLFKRYDAKPGRVPPVGFEACGEPDEITGHNPGWVPVLDAPENKHHLEAFRGEFADGTYELVGKRIQGNPYGLDGHELRRHGEVVVEVPRTFEGLREWLEVNMVEGLVFHHPDGRMAKIRRKDFNFKW